MQEPETLRRIVEETGLLTNTDRRPGLSLDGSWQYIVDPYDFGVHAHFERNAIPETKQDLIEYSFDRAGRLAVPGDWNTQHDMLFYYENPIWYCRTFTLHKEIGKRYFLHFGAVNYKAQVFVNTVFCGAHEGGFTPFNCEVTEALKEGVNFTVLRADSRREAEYVPAPMTDWFNYGGITRSVKLVVVPETFILDYFIQLRQGSMDTLEGWVQLKGSRLKQQITIGIAGANVHIECQSDDRGWVTFRTQAQLTLWEPANPYLYQVTIAAESDTMNDTIGFRSIETRGHLVYLNGTQLFLKGINIHEEAPIRGGRACSREDAMLHLCWAKELGCNFVRLAHYPHNEHMIRLAESLGLLVWSEVPVYWGIQWDNPVTYRNAEQQLTENVLRDKNRAPVILWSVGNEPDSMEKRVVFMQNLAARVRSLDDTRLVTAALHKTGVKPDTITVSDPLGACLDVVGINIYYGWYITTGFHFEKLALESVYDKPVIVSEMGACAGQGLHGPADERWNEEYQAAVYTNNFPLIERSLLIRGLCPWLLADFRSPRRLLPGIQDGWNRKGLVSGRGIKKKAFYTLQAFYNRIDAVKNKDVQV